MNPAVPRRFEEEVQGRSWPVFVFFGDGYKKIE